MPIVAATWPSVRVEDVRRGNEATLGIGNRQQMRILRLGLCRVFLILQRYDNDLCFSPGKILMTCFKLTELGHAKQSPAASEEYHYGLAVAL